MIGYGKSPVLKIFWIITLLFLMGTVSIGVEIPQEVEKCFATIDQTYGKAKTYQADVTIKVDLAIGNQQHSDSLATSLTWEKPNKIKTRAKDEKNSSLMVSDGEKYIKYLPSEKEYIIQSAPDSIRASEPMHAGVIGQIGGTSDVIASDKPSKTLKKDLVKASIKKDEKIGDTTCTVIHLTKTPRDKEVTIDLFMEKNTGRILKMIFDNKSFLPQDEGVDNRIFTVTEEHSNIRINETLPEGTFEFKAPKDVRKVDEFSFTKARKNSGMREKGAMSLEGKPAPAFSLKALDGKKHELSDYKGRFILLYFWATFSPPCRFELDFLQKTAKKHESKGLVLLTVNNEEDAELQKFLKENNLEITVLKDMEGKAGGSYKILTIPQLFLIDKNGAVIKVYKGLLDKQKMGKVIEEILSVE